MKVFISLSLAIAISTPSFGEGTHSADVQLPAATYSAVESLASVLAIPAPLPLGPPDRLKEYEGGMGAITQQFSTTLQSIVQGVQAGQLSRQQGEHISAEQYHAARMQFELLSALYEMLRQDMARSTVVRQVAAPSRDNEIVMVALPFSSLELHPSLAEYLQLSAEQVNAIEDLMSEERRNLKPLMGEMQATKAKLLAASAHRPTNEREVKTLAAAQARMLTQLIVANSRMQARLYKLLSPEQRKKLDAFKQSSPLLQAAQ